MVCEGSCEWVCHHSRNQRHLQSPSSTHGCMAVLSSSALKDQTLQCAALQGKKRGQGQAPKLEDLMVEVLSL